MTKEVDIQRTILDAVVELGGWGKKLSNMYINGIPDLGLVLTYSDTIRGSYWLEIKRMYALPRRDGDIIKFAHPLTLLQNKCLIDIRKAGGRAGWCIVFKAKTEDMIYVGHTLKDMPTKQEFLEKCLTRKIGPRGEKWTSVIPRILLRLH